MTSPSPLDIYIEIVKSGKPSTPAMIDENSIFILLSRITGNHIISYDDLMDARMTNIFIYDIPEDKKEFSIVATRQCVRDIDLMPYEWKNIYILRHFSTATIEAQNALLKILEDCPPYAVILMEVETSNVLLETIRSRSIDLTRRSVSEELYTLTPAIIQAYREHDSIALSRLLYDLKCTSTEAIAILRWVYPYMDESDMMRCDTMIEDLSTTHENPRSILDVFFL